MPDPTNPPNNLCYYCTQHIRWNDEPREWRHVWSDLEICLPLSDFERPAFAVRDGSVTWATPAHDPIDTRVTVEIEIAGVDHEQYFPGASTHSGGYDWDYLAIGIGDCEQEAVEDALSGLADQLMAHTSHAFSIWDKFFAPRIADYEDYDIHVGDEKDHIKDDTCLEQYISDVGGWSYLDKSFNDWHEDCEKHVYAIARLREIEPDEDATVPFYLDNRVEVIKANRALGIHNAGDAAAYKAAHPDYHPALPHWQLPS